MLTVREFNHVKTKQTQDTIILNKSLATFLSKAILFPFYLEKSGDRSYTHYAVITETNVKLRTKNLPLPSSDYWSQCDSTV